MNINFNLPGGFPLETDIFNVMQLAYKELQVFGASIGDYIIVNGCDVIGNTTRNGFLYFKGELIEFRGGLTQTKVVVNERKTRKQFQDGTDPEVFVERWVSFGTGTKSIEWSRFQRPKTNQQLTQDQKEKASAIDLELVIVKIRQIQEFIDNLGLATVTKPGLLSFQDKKKLNQVPAVTNIGWFGNFDVGNSAGPDGTSFNTSGQIVSAVKKSAPDKNSLIEVTVLNDMTSNYYVRFFAESNGDIIRDNNIGQMVFKKISSKKFEFSIEERDGRDKSLKIYVETITIP